MSGQSPLSLNFTAVLPATAANADFVAAVCVAPFAGTLTAASYIPDTAITGADTESRTINILNHGTDGATGTAKTMATLAFEDGTNGAQYDQVAATVSGTAADVAVAAGDVIVAQSLHIGSTGLADPGGTVMITLTRT